MLQYQLSHWEWESFFKDIDTVIIGSGIVGLSAAIHLKERAPKKNVVIVDRGPLPIGASTRNAGFACFGSLSELLDDMTASSKAEVLSLVAQRYQGLQRLRERYGDKSIGYEALGGYEVFRAEDKQVYERCRDQMEAFNLDLRQLIQQETFVSADQYIADTGMKGVEHLLLNQAEGQLNTGMLMRTLLRRAQSLDVQYLGGTTVTNFEETNGQVILSTNYGWEIKARQCLITTNGFAARLLPKLKVSPARNQVLITEPVEGLPLKGCYHYDRGYVYFRNVGNRLLLGGGRHLDLRGEETDELGQHPAIRSYLENLLRTVILPGREIVIDRWWSGIMGVGKLKKPIIQAVGEQSVAAVRLGGMGVALGTQVGEQAANMLLD